MPETTIDEKFSTELHLLYHASGTLFLLVSLSTLSFSEDRLSTHISNDISMVPVSEKKLQLLYNMQLFV